MSMNIRFALFQTNMWLVTTIEKTELVKRMEIEPFTRNVEGLDDTYHSAYLSLEDTTLYNDGKISKTD